MMKHISSPYVPAQAYRNRPVGRLGLLLALLGLILAVALASCAGAPAAEPAPAEPATEAEAPPRVFFRQPTDGAITPITSTVVMGAEGLVVEPAGEVREGAGHMHILIDTDFVAPGQVIPKDDQHLHFGDGATEVELVLPPGPHTLRLQFANGAHIALEGDQYRDEITIEVE